MKGHSSEVQLFINKFPENKRNKVAQFLLALGIDMAKKLGQQPGSTELYVTLSQLAKNIEQGGQRGTKQKSGPPRQGRQQHYSPQRYDDYEQPHFEQQKHDYRFEQPQRFDRDEQQYFDHRQQYQERYQSPNQERPYSKRDERQRSPNWHQSHRSHEEQYTNDYQRYDDRPLHQQDDNRFQSAVYSSRGNRMKSPKQYDSRLHQDQLTAKITESPPPMIYIRNMNTHIDVRRHLDDHQIKELLYDRDEGTPQKQYHGQVIHTSPPKSIHYSIPVNSYPTHQSNLLGSRTLSQERSKQKEPIRKEEKQVKQKKPKRAEPTPDKGKVPTYLKNVQSKIKDQIQYHKMLYHQHRDEQPESKRPTYQDEDEEFDNENINLDHFEGHNNPYEEPIRPSQAPNRFQQDRPDAGEYRQVREPNRFQKDKQDGYRPPQNRIQDPEEQRQPQARDPNRFQQDKQDGYKPPQNRIQDPEEQRQPQAREPNRFQQDKQDGYRPPQNRIYDPEHPQAREPNRIQQDKPDGYRPPQNRIQDPEEYRHPQAREPNRFQQPERPELRQPQTRESGRFQQDKPESSYGNQTAQFHPRNQGRPDAYYDIQQYLIDQRNLKQFSFSPVQEMNTIQEGERRSKYPEQTASEQRQEPNKRLQFQQVSDFQYRPDQFQKKKGPTQDQSPPFVQSSQKNSNLYNRPFQPDVESSQKPQSRRQGESKQEQSRQKLSNLKVDQDDDDSSDMFSNFTPPNKEVQEFFQRQFAHNEAL